MFCSSNENWIEENCDKQEKENTILIIILMAKAVVVGADVVVVVGSKMIKNIISRRII